MNQSVVNRPKANPMECYICGKWPATIIVTHKKRICEDCDE